MVSPGLSRELSMKSGALRSLSVAWNWPWAAVTPTYTLSLSSVVPASTVMAKPLLMPVTANPVVVLVALGTGVPLVQVYPSRLVVYWAKPSSPMTETSLICAGTPFLWLKIFVATSPHCAQSRFPSALKLMTDPVATGAKTPHKSALHPLSGTMAATAAITARPRRPRRLAKRRACNALRTRRRYGAKSGRRIVFIEVPGFAHGSLVLHVECGRTWRRVHLAGAAPGAFRFRRSCRPEEPGCGPL